jgi:hypothetical protein
VNQFWLGFRATLSRCWKAVARWVLGPGAAILVIIGGLLLLVFVGKLIPLGQVFDWITGRDKKPGDQRAVDVVNHPPEDRTKDGKPIEPGTPDSKGQTQAVVVPIETPGLFDRQDQVRYTPTGTDKPVVVDLPTGVQASEVKAVVVMTPRIVAVTVASTSKATPLQVEDLLKKYGTK